MNYPKQRYTGPKPWMEENWLYNEYVIKNRSSKEIAEEYGCKRNTIQCWLAKFKIKKDEVKRDIKHTKPYQEYNFLYNEHIVLHKSLTQIAKENNVSQDTIRYFCQQYGIEIWHTVQNTKLSEQEWQTLIEEYNNGASSSLLSQKYNISPGNIRRHLRKLNIKVRDLSEAQFSFNKKDYPELLQNKEWLQYQHWELNKSCKEIGEIVGCDAGTIRRHMQSLGIKTKTNSESKIGLMVGDKHPNWKNGKTSLTLILREFFQSNLAPLASKRDQYTCQCCGAQHTVLHVHHKKAFADIVDEIIQAHPEYNIQDNKYELYDIITKDKEFCSLDNLVTLCKDCHIKIHSKDNQQPSLYEEGSETIENINK